MPSDITEVYNKLTFIMVDSDTSTILASTALDRLEIIPELTEDEVQINNHKDNNGIYYLANKDTISGTIKFKNIIHIDDLKVSYDYNFKSVSGTLSAIEGEDRKVNFEIPLTEFPSTGKIIFEGSRSSVRVPITVKKLDMTVNVNKYLPLTGTIDGNIQISTNLESSNSLTVAAKYGEYDASTTSYNIAIDTKNAEQTIQIDLGSKITYNTEETLPTKLTFVIITGGVIVSHKTVDFVILQEPQIESITDASSTHQYKTNSRINLNIKRTRAAALEYYSFKYEFSAQNSDQMANPILNDINKPTKVSNTENDFTLQFTIPNNVEAGQKYLLLKLINPLNQESPVFGVSLTITKEREVTSSSITCQKTQAMMLDEKEYLFKCNIDNIETNAVIYKAKVGPYDSNGYTDQFDIDLRMNPNGNENEYNV